MCSESFGGMVDSFGQMRASLTVPDMVDCNELIAKRDL